MSRNKNLNFECIQAVIEGSLDKTKKFIEEGLDVNAKDEDNYTLLHYACQWNHIDIVEYLLELGADINCRNKYGMNPWMDVYDWKDRKIAKLLTRFDYKSQKLKKMNKVGHGIND